MPSSVNLTIYLIFFIMNFFSTFFIYLYAIPTLYYTGCFLSSYSRMKCAYQFCMDVQGWLDKLFWDEHRCIVYSMFFAVVLIVMSSDLLCACHSLMRLNAHHGAAKIVHFPVTFCFNCQRDLWLLFSEFLTQQDFLLKYSPSPCAFPLSQQLWLLSSEHQLDERALQGKQ